MLGNQAVHYSIIQRTFAATSLVSLLVCSGCDRSFDPRGPYQKRLVVYSILSTRSDSQYVRVYTTYNPSGFDPLENSSDTYVPNARVTIASDTSTYTLRNIVTPRVDKSRYTTDIVAYVAYPLPLRVGRTYALTIASADGDASATATVPGKGLVEANNPFIMKAPEKYNEDISAKVRLSSLTQGYVVRLYVDFDTPLGEGLAHHRVEVPMSIGGNDGLDVRVEYPRLKRRIVDRYVVYETVYFSLDAYKLFLQELTSQYGAFLLTSATFILTQVDPNLYKYFNLANGFQDEFSIRTDQPDFSSVEGGYGVFGAMADDSVVVDLSR